MIHYLGISQHISVRMHYHATTKTRMRGETLTSEREQKYKGSSAGWERCKDVSKVILCIPPAPFTQGFPVVLFVFHALGPPTRSARHHILKESCSLLVHVLLGYVKISWGQRFSVIILSGSMGKHGKKSQSLGSVPTLPLDGIDPKNPEFAPEPRASKMICFS